MYTVIIPLGLIVKTRVEDSIAAFDKFFKKMDLGLNLNSALLADLAPTIEKFNLGYLTEDAFATELLATLVHKIPPAKQCNIPQLCKDWPIYWRALWNQQCRVDNQVAEVLTRIHDKQLDFVIYSQTNPTNYAYIQEELHQYGVDLRSFNLLLSFRLHQLAPEMLFASLTKKQDLGTIILVHGSADKITDTYMHGLQRNQQARLHETLEQFDVHVQDIGQEEQLTPKALHNLIIMCQPGLFDSPPILRMPSPGTPPPEGGKSVRKLTL